MLSELDSNSTTGLEEDLFIDVIVIFIHYNMIN